MPIDFTPTPEQRALQRETRAFAHDVLRGVEAATRDLPTPEARFAATRPYYEQMIAAGLLRKCIPAPLGGECMGLIDVGILTEELYAVESSVTLTLLATTLGLTPLILAGTPAQQSALLKPFLATSGAPIAAFAFSEPGGSANSDAPAPAEGVRTRARLEGEEWVIAGAKQWVSSATGWDGNGCELICTVCRTDSAAPPESAISIIAIPGPRKGIVLEHAIDALGHRAHLVPRFRFDDVRVPRDHVLGPVGGGLALTAASFTGTAAIVGLLGAAIMRRAFDVALDFARTEKRGGAQPIIAHQAVGYALADAKAAIGAVRALSWRALHALDTSAPGALELALHAKIFGSETAVRVITDLMRVVGITSYDHACPLGSILQDALVLPIFDGGNIGIRRRQLHTMMMAPDYDPLTASGG